MAIVHPVRIAHRRTGVLFGIFASAFVSLVLGCLLAELMGVSAGSVNAVLFLVPLASYAAIGLATPADDGREFFTAGRTIPSHISGLSLALTTLGGTGFICITGALFKVGIDALVLVIGWVTGLVLVGVLLFPFLRKCGAYTVPSFLGLRLDSRLVRMVTALVLLLPTALILAAEVRIGAFVGTWLTGVPEPALVIVIAGVATMTVVLGGVRGLTWTSSSQAIAALIAMAVPATVVSLLISNLPFPQMMHGNLLQAFRRTEVLQAMPTLHAGAMTFAMPGAGLDAFTNRYLDSATHVGRLALPFAILVIATGIAGLPAVLQRAGTTTSVYETRKSVGWAVLTAAFILLTLASVAGFMRGYIVEQIVNSPGDRLPLWFQLLQQQGFAAVAKTRSAIALDSISIKRDVAFLALPFAAGLPLAIVGLAAAGALAAALAAVQAQIVALAGILSEDLVHGGFREPPEETVRLWSARLAVGLAGGVGLVGGLMVSDPLAVVLAGLAFSAATVFPVLLMSILWRKVSRLGAIAGMLTGAGVTAVLVLGSVSGVLGVSPLLAAALAGPANFAVLITLSQAAPLGARRAMEVVRDLRLPGGEATYDREMRLLRRKRATSAL